MTYSNGSSGTRTTLAPLLASLLLCSGSPAVGQFASGGGGVGGFGGGVSSGSGYPSGLSGIGLGPQVYFLGEGAVSGTVSTDGFIAVPDGIVFGKDLTNPVVMGALEKLGAYFSVADPDVITDRAMNLEIGEDWSSLRISRYENPIYSPEHWQHLRDLLPYIMPVGPDGTAPVVPSDPKAGIPVTPVRVAGGTINLADPTKLDWSGGLNGTDCFHPADTDINAFKLGLAINAVRVSTVLLKSNEILFNQFGTDKIRVDRFGHCTPEAALSIAQCSGLLEADGRTIWTARHCVSGANTNMVEEGYPDLAVGQSAPCNDETPMRAIPLLALTAEDFTVTEGDLYTCDSIERVGHDLIKVTLSNPMPVPDPNNISFGSWRLPKPGEMERLLTPDRRLYGAGYLHNAVLSDLMGGRLFPIEYCAETLASVIPVFDGHTGPDDLALASAELLATVPSAAMQYEGYACMSTDTFNGSSGGPIFAVDDDGETLILIGVISGAMWVTKTAECADAAETGLNDICGVAPTGRFNTLALLTETALKTPEPALDCEELVDAVVNPADPTALDLATRRLLTLNARCAGSISNYFASEIETPEHEGSQDYSKNMLVILSDAAKGNGELKSQLETLAAYDSPEQSDLFAGQVRQTDTAPYEPMECDDISDATIYTRKTSWHDVLSVVRSGDKAAYVKFFGEDSNVLVLQSECLVQPFVESATVERLEALSFDLEPVYHPYGMAAINIGHVLGVVGRTRPDLRTSIFDIIDRVFARAASEEDYLRDDELDLLSIAIRDLGDQRPQVVSLVAAWLPSLVPADQYVEWESVSTVCDIIGAVGPYSNEAAFVEGAEAFIDAVGGVFGADHPHLHSCLGQFLSGLLESGYRGDVGMNLVEQLLKYATEHVSFDSDDAIIAYLIDRADLRAVELLTSVLRADLDGNGNQVFSETDIVHALAEIGPLAEPALPTIVELLLSSEGYDGGGWWRLDAGSALRIGGWLTLEELYGSFGISDSDRWKQAIGILDSNSSMSAAGLGDLLHDVRSDGPFDDARTSLVRLLPKAGPGATSLLTLLVESERPDIRKVAYWALAEILADTNDISAPSAEILGFGGSLRDLCLGSSRESGQSHSLPICG